MSTSKLVIKHPDGEEVEIVVGNVVKVSGMHGKHRIVDIKSNYGDIVVSVVPSDIPTTIGAWFKVDQLHNLPAKLTRPMNQAERLAVLRGGCEVRGKLDRWHGCPSYWIVEGSLTICGEECEVFTHYRCAPDWTVEREFVVEVDG